ncbi:MAG TPA: hypothetical protein VGX50_20380 [Longimicrobium sp.]|nr:hypothetical protein [Longimicrobium sp.]
MRAAVVDGVLSSFFSGPWARLLAAHFRKQGLPLPGANGEPSIMTWLKVPTGIWPRRLERRIRPSPIAYLLRNRLQRGDPAAATFAGIELEPADTTGTRTWRAMVVGDACLFHLYRTCSGELAIHSEMAPELFGYHTEALLSTPGSSPANPGFRTGTASVGDIFLLATDALADWLRAQPPEPGWGGDPLQRLLSGRHGLAEVVKDGRLGRIGAGWLADDDATCVILELGPDT